MRQPDIEIYLKDADVDHKAIAAWLGAALGPCSDWVQKGQTYKCKAGNVPVTWLPKAVGKWNSLYLESDQTPWDDDIACARAAFVALNVEVRCAPGTWVEEEGEESADTWIRISEDGTDVFVHYRAIRGEGHRSLAEGQQVEYAVVTGEKGLQAEDVVGL